MSFLSLPVWAVIAGAFGLAALLFALQILKARQKLVRIAAAGLWAQAARVTPLRVFRQRFQRWLAYLLIVAIALLLWFAGARPEMAPARDAADHIFYLDASAGLMGRDDLAQARRALIADARNTDPARRRVYLDGAVATPLLQPGENLALLSQRLDGVRARPAPSSFAEAFVSPELDGAASPRRPTVFHYYGAWSGARPVTPSAGRRLVYGYLAAPTPDNRGIVALGASPAASGDAGRADILVEAIGADGVSLPADALRFSRDGRDVAVETLARPDGRLVVRDVIADGGLFAVRLARSDAFPADDQAGLRLPDRRPVRVALSPGAPAAVVRAVRLNPAFTVTAPQDAQVVVRRGSEWFGEGRPALVVSQAGDQSAFVFTYGADEAEPNLAGALDALGVSAIETQALARFTRRDVAAETRPGQQRGVAVWSALFDEAGGFPAASSFPVFVARTLSWLADAGPWIPYAQAGTDLTDQSDLFGLSSDRRIADRAMKGDLFLNQAGETRIGDLRLAVALTNREITMDAARAAPADMVVTSVRGPAVDLLFILLVVIAGLLLLFEWRLHQRGAMA
ncbi:hypothetical protein GCM10017620_13030 [Brevundimonas intermedia]|uniref:Aerotolerance regulator N-terminal domain-containing protein n=1 Tax=Brevundimonas intermedia TaxID=74315 RepID=A0ABQ5T845_9CAUL|nr:hypothetical protein [Brevundimonas intermedia]GLK48330.1 hypothetical protein GCM10017620_13030 [Brevundimonas intermedia]